MNVKKYFVWFHGDDDPIVINIEDDVNRPNNPDCDTVLTDWLHDNYGYKTYEYAEINSLEIINL